MSGAIAAFVRCRGLEEANRRALAAPCFKGPKIHRSQGLLAFGSACFLMNYS